MRAALARGGWPLLLALAFAAHVGMTVALAGRTSAAALAACQALGALALAAIAAGRPLAAARGLDARSRKLACAGGLAGILGPVAVLAAARMSDAPAGSVVVFWMAGGWALIAALAAAIVAWRSQARSRTALALAGGIVALAGAAGIVANWERPSSFSPLVRFPVQELAILAAGALLIAGAFAVLRAAKGGRLDGALLWAATAAAAGGFAWWLVTGAKAGLGSLAERPVEVMLAALAWGCVWLALPRVLRAQGPARAGALLAAVPLLLSTLIWLEQLVGVAGPQPMIAAGVVAGCITLVAGALALWRSADAEAPPAAPLSLPASPLAPPASPHAATTAGAPARTRTRTLAVLAAALVPLALACVALAMPAIDVTVDVNGAAGPFAGSWTLLGFESVAGVTAIALAALLAALTLSRSAWWPATAGLAACAAWAANLATPMHVLVTWLPPGVEQYYGTEYGSIGFSSVPVPWMIASVATCAAGFVALIAFDAWRRLSPAARQQGK